MSQLAIAPGSTGVRVPLSLQTNTGAPLTGAAFNTSGLVAYYLRPGAALTAITLATQTVTGAYSSGGFVEVSSANAPGEYLFDVPNAVLAAGVRWASVWFSGIAAMAPFGLLLDLTNDSNVVSLSTAAIQSIQNAALTESYAALHSSPTLAQALFEMRALLAGFSISGTTLSSYKLDGSTVAATYTLNSATTPSSILRAT